MPFLSYDDAESIASAARVGEIATPPYLGGTHDFAYLRQWVLDLATSTYGVEKEIFDTPTVASTALLRDLVSKFNWQQPYDQDLKVWNKEGDLIAPPREDIAEMFRYPSRGVCGHIGFALQQVFDAFGYPAHRIASNNGDFVTHTDGHNSTEVWVADLGKWIIQDATFNFVIRDSDGVMLSFLEAREASVNGETLTFDTYQVLNGYPAHHQVRDSLSEEWVTRLTENEYRVVRYEQDAVGGDEVDATKVHRNWATAYSAPTSDAGLFDSAEAAYQAVQGAVDRGLTFTQAAAALRADDMVVSGFQLIAEDGSADTFLTVRMADGRYLTLEYAPDGATLTGSFDQLASQVLMGGADLGFDFLRPANILSWDGVLMKTDLVDHGQWASSEVGDPGDETIIGSAHRDFLFGEGGNDVLHGKAGDDVLVGGAGKDKLYGGVGADTFSFGTDDSHAGYTNRDAIFGFEQQDEIRLVDAEWSYIRIATTADWTNTILQGDTDSDGVADVEVVLIDYSGSVDFLV